jgi:hypothetical protein
MGRTPAPIHSLIVTGKANRIELYVHPKMIFAVLPKATSLQDIEALLPFGEKFETTKEAS